MKKPVYWILLVLFAYMFVSCAGTTPKLVEPGGKIGDMTIEKSSASQRYPSIWAYCDPGQAPHIEPYTSRIDCEVPLTSGIKIEFGWGAKDETLLTSNLEAIVWELYIDVIRLTSMHLSHPVKLGQSDLQEIGHWPWLILLRASISSVCYGKLRHRLMMALTFTRQVRMKTL
jgi:hypothetical protein